MILMLPIALAFLAITLAAPVAAAWAAWELARPLSVPARVGLAVLAVAGSVWWLAVPDLTGPGALLSWSAVAIATVAAGVQAMRRLAANRARRRQELYAWNAWYAQHPVMPQAWYADQSAAPQEH